MTSSPPVWRGAGLTDRGLVRPSNQDAFALEDVLHLWVIADGMGGHAGGEVASRLAVDAVLAHVRSRASTGEASTAPPVTDERVLHDAMAVAQRAILDEASAQAELRGMGTTCVALRIVSAPHSVATIAHVGDSRAYRLRGDRLEQLTQDHSVVEDYVKRGRITPAQAFTHPLRHVLSRALGSETACDADVGVHDLEDSDLILLCTDGLTKMVRDDRIAELLRQERMAPDRACQALVREALIRGGADNVTVIVCTRRA